MIGVRPGEIDLGRLQPNESKNVEENNESDIKNKEQNQYEDDSIYIDPLFLYLISFYEIIVRIINDIEWFTKCATYKLISLIIYILLLVYFILKIWKSNGELLKQQSMFNEKEMILKMIIQNKAYEDFFNAQRLFIKLNESDLKRASM
jgi:hypothetical protein